jgi:Rad3-related DNA helicase
MGVSSLFNNTEGNAIIAIGSESGQNSSGSSNTFIGHRAGKFVTGSANTIIGGFESTAGTILNKNTFCQNIGIDPNKAEFLSMDSPFHVKNRPVFEVPVGSMGRKSIDATLPKMVATIKELLDHHKDEKGIIHCHNYKIAKYISDNINSDRLLFHSSDDRIDVLNFHIKTSHPTVLVSPSFTEGIDLQGKRIFTLT